MRAFVYPEKTYEEIGSVRYTVEWHTTRPGYVQGEESADPDRDLICHSRSFKTLAAARREARRRVDECYYGCPVIQREVVDWYVEEDRIAEWASAGEPIYVE